MKVKIAGSALVLVSSLKFEALKKIEKFNPMALVTYDEDQVPVFVVGTSATPCINKNGVQFNAQDKDGFAEVTFMIPSTIKDRKEFVTDNFGLTLLNLSDAEEKIDKAIEALDLKFDKIEGQIETV